MNNFFSSLLCLYFANIYKKCDILGIRYLFRRKFEIYTVSNSKNTAKRMIKSNKATDYWV